MKVLLQTTIALVTSIAVLVPAATASVRPDDRAGARGPARAWVDPSIASVVDAARQELWLDPSIASVIASEKTSLWLDPSIAGTLSPARSDELWLDPALAEGVRSALATSVRPDDRGTRREAPLGATAAPTSSFDWGTAGIRAGATGVLVLILGGIALSRIQRRTLEHA